MTPVIKNTSGTIPFPFGYFIEHSFLPEKRKDPQNRKQKTQPLTHIEFSPPVISHAAVKRNRKIQAAIVVHRRLDASALQVIHLARVRAKAVLGHLAHRHRRPIPVAPTTLKHVAILKARACDVHFLAAKHIAIPGPDT